MSVTHSTKQLHRLWCYASRRESGRERWAPKSVRGAGNDEQLLRASAANCAAAVPSFANPPPRSLLLAARRCWCRHGAPLALLCLALASWVRSSQRSKEDKKKKLPPSFLFSLVLHVPPLFLHLFSSLSLCVCGCVHNVGTAGLLQIGHACRKRGRKRVGPREYYEGTEREVGQRGSPPRKRIGWDGNMERKIELREREREGGEGERVSPPYLNCTVCFALAAGQSGTRARGTLSCQVGVVLGHLISSLCSGCLRLELTCSQSRLITSPTAIIPRPSRLQPRRGRSVADLVRVVLAASARARLPPAVRSLWRSRFS